MVARKQEFWSGGNQNPAIICGAQVYVDEFADARAGVFFLERKARGELVKNREPSSENGLK